ncbi:hypothetical protein [Shewanella woodyi]|uniref:Uncharacterized protein n=1 Tax=Shewanella woodyi (strain ATCC 51908 / MS32) TaxID=392500 RepID=B1KPQ3_SHEWM|nr:hypothetical protein [Shewanella woodyi]ACA87586.1 conserved hypothetical protein [Shewanella woodyi ATCC 51908]
MKDENIDKPAEFDDELQQLYKAQEQEVPSAELDEAILKLARAAVKKSQDDNVVIVETSFWRRHRWPLSSAASVMFVATLLLINQDVTQDILSDDVPVMMQMSEPQGELGDSDSAQPAAMDTRSYAGDKGVEAQSVQETDEMKRTAPRAMASSPQAEALPAKSSPNTAQQQSDPKVESIAISVDDIDQDVRAKIESLSSSKSAKTASQREAMVSAKQALNHLESLVEMEKWADAEKLVLKLRRNYPELRSEDHPQHLRWKALSEQVIIPLPKPKVPSSDK